MPLLPPVPEPFYWTTHPWGAALRCGALDPLADHLFTSRQLGLPADDAWTTLAATLDVAPEHLWRLRQVHGHAVVTVRDGQAMEGGGARDARPEADALIGEHPGSALAVMAADCVPILLADRRLGAVAAVHAGWRGTAAKIVGKTLTAMQATFGCHTSDLIAVIGPSIRMCCYEVGTELVDAFAAQHHERYLIDRWFIAKPPRRGERERPKLRLDVAGANSDQLILAGVPEEQIFDCGLCTATHLDVLTSFRAEGEAAGRMAAAIRPRPHPHSHQAPA